MMKEVLIRLSAKVSQFICQESFHNARICWSSLQKKNLKWDELKWPHYYDNNLIFKVTKERASIKTTWDLSCSSSTSSHMDHTNCVLR